MTYNWDRKLLRQLYKDPKVREELSQLYFSLWDIFRTAERAHKSKITTTVGAYSYFKEYGFIEKYFDMMAQVDNIGDAIYTPENYISQDYNFELVHDFYKQTNPIYFEAFQKFFNERFTHFKFTKPGPGHFYSGGTYVSHTANELFIAVNDTKDLDIVDLTAHEYGHAINYYLHPQNSFIRAKSHYEEITSIFMELLCFDFLDTKPELINDVNYQRKKLFITLLNDIEKMDFHLTLANNFGYVIEHDDAEDMSFNKLYKKTMNELSLTKKEFNILLQNAAYYISPYVIGTLIAIELYHIYQNDPEKAFYLLEQIHQIEAETPEEVDRKINELGICPTQSIDTYTRKLKL